MSFIRSLLDAVNPDLMSGFHDSGGKMLMYFG